MEWPEGFNFEKEFFHSAQGEVFHLMARKMRDIFLVKKRISRALEYVKELAGPENTAEREKWISRRWKGEEEARRLIGELHMLVGELENLTDGMNAHDFWHRLDERRGGCSYTGVRGWNITEPKSWLEDK
ncbi:hypothetical protein [uncultured Fretibacterium sp.]|uniref:hypothetical protein n=1 Tax=uncultured Fretibacterium sp. TaxID=1678694 RepID=UPI00262EC9F9|nr:hypothetical protein [uncultured Fretibacterium sp.]